MRRLLALVVVARGARVPASAAAAFANTEPFAAKQWYLDQRLAWTSGRRRRASRPSRSRSSTRASTARIPTSSAASSRRSSFVGGSPYHDEQGHGTFVAGEIAANPANAIGIAGLAFNARLIVAKVVEPDGDGLAPGRGRRDPLGGRPGRARDQPQPRRRARPARRPQLDTYSPLEQAAVEYAYSKGVRRGRGGRERPAVAGDAVAVRRTTRLRCRT